MGTVGAVAPAAGPLGIVLAIGLLAIVILGPPASLPSSTSSSDEDDMSAPEANGRSPPPGGPGEDPLRPPADAGRAGAGRPARDARSRGRPVRADDEACRRRVSAGRPSHGVARRPHPVRGGQRVDRDRRAGRGDRARGGEEAVGAPGGAFVPPPEDIPSAPRGPQEPVPSGTATGARATTRERPPSRTRSAHRRRPPLASRSSGTRSPRASATSPSACSSPARPRLRPGTHLDRPRSAGLLQLAVHDAPDRPALRPRPRDRDARRERPSVPPGRARRPRGGASGPLAWPAEYRERVRRG